MLAINHFFAHKNAIFYDNGEKLRKRLNGFSFRRASVKPIKQELTTTLYSTDQYSQRSEYVLHYKQ